MNAEWPNREYPNTPARASTGPKTKTRQVSNGSSAEGLLSWPDLDWQQAALAGAVVLGLVVAAVGVGVIADEPGSFVGGLVSILAGLGFAGMALYAGLNTDWLNDTSTAPVAALVAGGLTVGVIIILAVTVYGAGLQSAFGFQYIRVRNGRGELVLMPQMTRHQSHQEQLCIENTYDKEVDHVLS